MYRPLRRSFSPRLREDEAQGPPIVASPIDFERRQHTLHDRPRGDSHSFQPFRRAERNRAGSKCRGSEWSKEIQPSTTFSIGGPALHPNRVRPMGSTIPPFGRPSDVNSGRRERPSAEPYVHCTSHRFPKTKLAFRAPFRCRTAGQKEKQRGESTNLRGEPPSASA